MMVAGKGDSAHRGWPWRPCSSGAVVSQAVRLEVALRGPPGPAGAGPARSQGAQAAREEPSGEQCRSQILAQDWKLPTPLPLCPSGWEGSRLPALHGLCPAEGPCARSLPLGQPSCQRSQPLGAFQLPGPHAQARPCNGPQPSFLRPSVTPLISSTSVLTPRQTVFPGEPTRGTRCPSD